MPQTEKTKFDKLKKMLATLYKHDGPERVGFIKSDHQIIEVPNLSDKPMDGFKVRAEDIIKYTETQGCWGTWHSHPKESANLSGEDYRSFKNWPDLTHFIIGEDEVRVFKWDEQRKAVMEIE